jgi:hypothetical protein
LLKEAHREIRGIRFIDTLFQDLQYGQSRARQILVDCPRRAG